MSALTDKILGTHSEHELKRIAPAADKVDSLSDQMASLSDEGLKDKTAEFKERLKNGETEESILPEAYAVVREAAKRVLGLYPFREQVLGAIVLHNGCVAEQLTGQGKTLVAVMPSYLNALSGNGVHVVTVNDYLAERDAEMMGQVHRFLGLSCDYVLHSSDRDRRKKAYQADITYVTNTELGFDYLRDHIASSKDDVVLRGLNYAVIDEADSVLIDEARTPLIISGDGDSSHELISRADEFVKTLMRGNDLKTLTKRDLVAGETIEEFGDYSLNEKDSEAALTTEGFRKAEAFFHVDNISDLEHTDLLHYIRSALRANYLMHKDKQYIVSKDQEVMIVDEFTGRVMPGRRFSDGLHQAIEAKEGVEIKDENRTLATITYQSFFNHYRKKAGMTGTADTSKKEFRDIYSLDVIKIPPHQPVIREDMYDLLFRTDKERDIAVAKAAREAYERRQPVLIGTQSVEASEKLSELLDSMDVPHRVLNAKQDKEEAETVALAGRAGAVTVATNMAGRGTDIKLTDEAREAGGLFVIGTERSESRRIDDQLVGRSGRQGDPGASRFYLSMEDPLFRLFGRAAQMDALSKAASDEEGRISHPLIEKAVRAAQENLEATHTASRFQTFRYDQVIADQRDTFYKDRDTLLFCDTDEELTGYLSKSFAGYVAHAINCTVSDEGAFDAQGFIKMFAFLPFPIIFTEENTKSMEALADFMSEEMAHQYEIVKTHFSFNVIKKLVTWHLLHAADACWQEYIDSLDYIRDNAKLQQYAQRDPFTTFENDSAKKLEELMEKIPSAAIPSLFYALQEWEKKRKEKLEESNGPVRAVGTYIQHYDKEGNPIGKGIHMQQVIRNV